MLNLIDKDNTLWSFFIDNENNFCYTYSNNSPQILLEKCTDEFDCVFDKKGNIHVAVQKVDGEICYITHYENKWEKYIVMKNRYGKQSFSNLNLFVVMGIPHLYYTLYHNYRYYLVNHTINTNKLISPTVLDYSYNGKFCVVYDSNIFHIVYKDEEERFIYLKYNPNNNTCEKNFISLTQSTKDFSIAIYNGRLNIVYISRCKKHYTVNHTTNNDFQIKTLGFGIDNFCIPHMFVSDSKLNIIWEERYFLYFTKSNDCKNFSKINITNRNGQLVKHKYYNNKIEYKIESTY
ncbi:MAG: hypothetical protein E7391_03185 [Ruminococcaceae bacterium]|nr:hypothetical protein [Oscillospiraceae bacterium]